MGNSFSISARERLLLGAVGVSSALTLYMRNECEVQRIRKNELALSLMGLRQINMGRGANAAYGSSFRPRPSDVFIATYPKCGTTWMMQICHMLRGGEMNFGEITEVCPWDVWAEKCGQDLDADQVKEPRIFKSHSLYDNIAKGGKYIYVARNPEDVFVSFFNFAPGYFGLHQDDITMHQFADFTFINSGGPFSTVWDHFMNWYEVKDEANVLWVFFEDLKKDLKAQIQRVAEFLDIPENVREKRVLQAVEKSSFKFMSSQEQKHHFDDHFIFDNTKGDMGLPDEAKIRVSKVRQGRMGQRLLIPTDIRERLEEQWKERIAAKINCENYDSFRCSFQK